MRMKLPILQTIFISAVMNVDFIPRFIPEGNLDPSLYDSESTFISRSIVCSIRNEKWDELSADS